jgi:hypothetical protein
MRSRLDALPQKIHRFEADVDGDFPDHTYPTAAILELKTGAQVMFVRNDLSPERRYFNGKIGTISRISGSDIRIQCPEDTEEIGVEPATWENIDVFARPKDDGNYGKNGRHVQAISPQTGLGHHHPQKPGPHL